MQYELVAVNVEYYPKGSAIALPSLFEYLEYGDKLMMIGKETKSPNFDFDTLSEVVETDLAYEDLPEVGDVVCRKPLMLFSFRAIGQFPIERQYWSQMEQFEAEEGAWEVYGEFGDALRDEARRILAQERLREAYKGVYSITFITLWGVSWEQSGNYYEGAGDFEPIWDYIGVVNLYEVARHIKNEQEPSLETREAQFTQALIWHFPDNARITTRIQGAGPGSLALNVEVFLPRTGQMVSVNSEILAVHWDAHYEETAGLMAQLAHRKLEKVQP